MFFVDRRVTEATQQLGEEYYYGGRPEDALEQFHHALAARRQTLGDDDIETIESTNNVAAALVALGRTDANCWDQAEALLLQTLPAAKQHLGDSATTAKTLDWLMSLNKFRGDIEVARRYGAEGVAMVRKIHHEAHPELLFWLDKYSYLLPHEEAIEVLRVSAREATRNT